MTGLCVLSHLASPPCVQVPMPPSMSRFPPPSLPLHRKLHVSRQCGPPNDAAKRPAAAVTEKGNNGGAAAAAAEGLHFLEWLALGGEWEEERPLINVKVDRGGRTFVFSTPLPDYNTHVKKRGTKRTGSIEFPCPIQRAKSEGDDFERIVV